LETAPFAYRLRRLSVPRTLITLVRRPLSLRWHLVVLSVGVILPVVAFAALLTARLASGERALAERRLVSRARSLAAALDREMGSSARTLQALASSERLDGPLDPARFYAEAKRVHESQPSWLAVVLLTPDGQQEVNTFRPFGDPLQGALELPSLRRAVETRQPAVSDLGRPLEGRLAFAVRVPVIRSGEVTHVLTAITPHEVVAHVLAPTGAEEEDWTRTVVDRGGVVVARTRDPGRFLGQRAPQTVLDLIAGPGEGAAEMTTLDGTPGYVAFSRAALSGWTVAVTVPLDVVRRPVRRSLAAEIGVGLALVLVSGAAAAFGAFRLSRAIGSAAAAGDALGRGGRLTAERSSVLELLRLRQALERAAELLRARERERDEHLARAEASRQEAEAATRAKDEFLAMLGHELRNPLSPIVTALHLERVRDGKPTREHEVIVRQVQHLVRLVDDLLDVSRITRGKLVLSSERVELGAVVARAVEMASPLLEGRCHALEVDVPEVGLAVRGDPHRLAQVVANLLTNAAKYTPPHGHVRVRSRRDANEVRLEVTDDGQGIPAELLPRVFELFVQGQRSADRHEGGLGLGLALVRSLVTAHGGRVDARSDGPGRGSTFTIVLPDAREGGEPPAIAAPPAARAVRSGARARVLVVDDNVDAAELLNRLLTGAGHEVRSVHDGPAALEALDGFLPQVAVLDVGLPVMDGYELADRIRERLGAAAPVFVGLTGYGQSHDAARSRAAGFERHFVKPADSDELLQAVEELAVAPGRCAGASRSA
jgi:signal transduction histidine kinase/ActR/RegA family two-component response regulator